MYQIEKIQRIVVDAPDINEDDLMTISEASRYLGISITAITQRINHGDISSVTRPGVVTAHKRAKRWVLRDEIEELKTKRESRRVTVDTEESTHK